MRLRDTKNARMTLPTHPLRARVESPLDCTWPAEPFCCRAFGDFVSTDTVTDTEIFFQLSPAFSSPHWTIDTISNQIIVKTAILLMTSEGDTVTDTVRSRFFKRADA